MEPNELTGNDRDLVQHSTNSGRSDNAISFLFVAKNDRFGHQMIWQTDGNDLVLTRSVERPGQACSSAPIQEVVVEKHGEREFLLGVGQADKNHWSASIGSTNSFDDRKSSNESPQIKAEFACRINREAEWLGSLYQIDADCTVVEFDTERLVLAAKDQQFVIHATTESVIEYDESDRILAIRPKELARAIPTTLTWTYTLTMATGKR